MKPITLFCADTAGQPQNKHYPRQLGITSAEDLAEAVRFDHVAAKYQGNLRGNSNFQVSDCLVMDIDNDHSENPEDWVFPADLANLLPGVALMTATSRNHMKDKGVVAARPRFHAYLPIAETTDAKEYASLKRLLAARFDFFDRQALDAGRFIFGTENSEVTAVTGELTADNWLEQTQDRDLFAQFDAATMAIGEGSRNSTMSRFAARVLVRYGNTDQARELFDRRAGRCAPPLEDVELEAIWRSATRFAKKVAADPAYVSPEVYANLTSLRPDDFTDLGEAAVMAAECAYRARYSPATDWMVYRGSKWEESGPAGRVVVHDLTDRQLDEAIALKEAADERMRACGAAGILQAMSRAKALGAFTSDQLRAFQESESATAYYKYVLKRRDSRAISATLKEAAGMLEIEPAAFDDQPFLLNTPGATYDLRVGLGSARPHAAEDFLTRQTSVDPKTAGMEEWEAALDVFFQADADLIRYVQRIVGLAAFGKVFVEALVIAYGDGRNGKSTFWNTIARVLGSYSGNISADVLTVGARRNVKPELAEAKGKRLLIAAELEEGMRLNTSNVKQLASTDEIFAEKKYKAPFAFIPSHQLVLYTNHLPRVGATDDGIWRRLIVIPFEAKIQGGSDIKNYADHLYDKAGGAVLAWIMEGARLVHAEGYQLTQPARVQAASAVYKENNDWFSKFVEECCDIGEALTQRSGELYQEYRAWSARTGEYARSTSDFYAALDQAGYQRKRTNKGSIVYNLALNSEFGV